MNQDWQSSGSSSMNHTERFGSGFQSAPLQAGRGTNGQYQQQQSSAYNYEAYPSGPSASNGLSMASTPSATPQSNDYSTEADVPMEDADPYNRSKYPSRPIHQRGSSTSQLAYQGSSAAQRYSPMDMLSPSGAHAASPKSQSQNSFSYHAQTPGSRQSPPRQQYYPGAAQHYQDSPSKPTKILLLPS